MGDFGIVEALTAAAISVAASAISAAVFKPKAQQLPSNFAKNEITKGGYIPLIMGRRIVGCSVGWVGDRKSHAALHAGGSEIMAQPSGGNIYYEGGWHQLCVGPIRKLHRIFAGNQTIFSREIDFSVVPDGSLYQLAKGFQARDADYFRVFSGRDRRDGVDYQPVDSYLKKHTGFASSWPGLAFLVWQRKNLGGSPTWPVMKYEITTEPEGIAQEIGPWPPE